MKRQLFDKGDKPVIRSDNGPQCISNLFEEACNDFETDPQAYEVVSQFIQDYNRIRIHGSIYDLSPYEYMEAVKQGMVKPKEIKV